MLILSAGSYFVSTSRVIGLAFAYKDTVHLYLEVGRETDKQRGAGREREADGETKTDRE